MPKERRFWSAINYPVEAAAGCGFVSVLGSLSLPYFLTKIPILPWCIFPQNGNCNYVLLLVYSKPLAPNKGLRAYVVKQSHVGHFILLCVNHGGWNAFKRDTCLYYILEFVSPFRGLINSIFFRIENKTWRKQILWMYVPGHDKTSFHFSCPSKKFKLIFFPGEHIWSNLRVHFFHLKSSEAF